VSNPHRIQDLRRQKALIQEHLAWLEQEILAAGDVPSRPLSVKPGPMAAVTRPDESRSTAGPITEADALLSQLVAEEKKAPPSKYGCWMIFWLILLGAGAVIGGTVYWIYH